MCQYASYNVVEYNDLSINDEDLLLWSRRWHILCRVRCKTLIWLWRLSLCCFCYNSVCYSDVCDTKHHLIDSFSSCSTSQVCSFLNHNSNHFIFHLIIFSFYRASYAKHGLGSRNSVHLSVCLSVRLSHACFVTNPKNLLAIFLYHMKGQSF